MTPIGVLRQHTHAAQKSRSFKFWNTPLYGTSIFLLHFSCLIRRSTDTPSDFLDLTNLEIGAAAVWFKGSHRSCFESVLIIVCWIDWGGFVVDQLIGCSRYLSPHEPVLYAVNLVLEFGMGCFGEVARLPRPIHANELLPGFALQMQVWQPVVPEMQTCRFVRGCDGTEKKQQQDSAHLHSSPVLVEI